jgi:ribose transport system permease protein
MLAGVKTGRAKWLAYIISGGLAGVASFLLMCRFLSGAPQTGAAGWAFKAIAASVVGGVSLMGGRGTILRAFVGALFIGALENWMNLANLNSYLQDVVIGVVILSAVTIDQLRKNNWSIVQVFGRGLGRLQTISRALEAKD